jgi:hypothetical protein
LIERAFVASISPSKSIASYPELLQDRMEDFVSSGQPSGMEKAQSRRRLCRTSAPQATSFDASALLQELSPVTQRLDIETTTSVSCLQENSKDRFIDIHCVCANRL